MTQTFFQSSNLQLRLVAMAALLLGSTAVAVANEMTVDRQSLQLDDNLLITVTLNDSFAAIESVTLPVTNLSIEGPPSTSSELQIINGSMTRRKVFQFTAHPKASGPALVGPVVLVDPDGKRDTLAPISIQVLPDMMAGSNDPLRILRELEATGRDPVFLLAEADKTSAMVGEEIVVTWWLLTGVSLQQFSLRELPPLTDFWTEEINLSGQQPQRVLLGGRVLQKAAIRRAALFPLHAGKLVIGSLRTQSAFLKRNDRGFNPFGVFEGRVVEAQQHSAPIAIEVRALPAGAGDAMVGDFSIHCQAPRQPRGGPVIFELSISGRGNLRGAEPPRWEGRVDGEAEVRDRGLTVQRGDDEVAMTRTWRAVIDPARAGRLAIPALAMKTVTPLGEVRTLRCEATSLMADPSQTPKSAVAQEPVPSLLEAGVRLPWRPIAGSGAALLLIAICAVLVRWRGAQRRAIRELLGAPGTPPREMIERIDQRLRLAGVDPRALLVQPSAVGDAYRALRSLLDALERDQYVENREKELRRRASELVREWKRPEGSEGEPDEGTRSTPIG